MRCDRCYGRAGVWLDDEHWGPCPECFQIPVLSCCDGVYTPIEAPPNLKKNRLPDDPSKPEPEGKP